MNLSLPGRSNLGNNMNEGQKRLATDILRKFDQKQGTEERVPTDNDTRPTIPNTDYFLRSLGF